MNKWIAVSMVFALASFASGEEDCVMEGFSEDVRFDRPELGFGYPTSAMWLDETGVPTGWEYDPVSSDDPLGPAVPGHGSLDGTASIRITNDGGFLSGPNGDVQNGLGSFEGDCIEVFACWSYSYEATRIDCISTGVQVQVKVGEAVGAQGGGSVGSSVCFKTEVLLVATVCSEAQEVCAC